jgi:hypothetical protein
MLADQASVEPRLERTIFGTEAKNEILRGARDQVPTIFADWCQVQTPGERTGILGDDRLDAALGNKGHPHTKHIYWDDISLLICRYLETQVFALRIILCVPGHDVKGRSAPSIKGPNQVTAGCDETGDYVVRGDGVGIPEKDIAELLIEHFLEAKVSRGVIGEALHVAEL